MKTTDLMKYLKSVLETEKNVYVLTQATNKLRTKIDRLGNEGKERLKELAKESSALVVSNVTERSSAYKLLRLLPFIGMAVGALFACTIIAPNAYAPTSFDRTMNYVVSIPLSAGVGAAVGGFIRWVGRDKKKISAKKAIKASKIVNAEYSQAYNEAINSDSKYLETINTKSNMQKYYNEMMDQLEQTKGVLRKLYSLDILHASYRNMVAVASIYQYYDTGRCTTLKGHEGAYNLFENERRMNMIISQLNIVIEKLDEIKASQFALYSAIKDGNRKIDKLIANSELALDYAKATYKNSEIIATNTDIIRQNTSFLSMYEFYKSMF